MVTNGLDGMLATLLTSGTHIVISAFSLGPEAGASLASFLGSVGLGYGHLFTGSIKTGH